MSLNLEGVGGYPISLFVNCLSDELICAVCRDILRNPHSCKNGHNFCLTCFTQSVETQRECPLCKTFVSVNDFTPCLALRNIIDQMNVRCQHTSVLVADDTFACYWSGKLADFEQHKKTCIRQLVPCSLYLLGNCMECSGQVMRGKLERHFITRMNDTTLSKIASVVSECSILKNDIISLKEELNGFKQSIVPGHCVVKDEYGGIYSGEMLNRQRHGQGTLQYTDSDNYYSGGWTDGDKSGFGVEKIGNYVYSGEFENNERHGDGCVKCHRGFQYNGAWREGIYHGFGTYKWASGETYTGDFVNGLLHGRGVRVDNNGDKYEGQFINNSFSGFGKCTYANGDIYEGDWIDDEKSGHGVLTFKDGSVYTGDDSCHGKGSLKSTKGTVTKGIWIKGMKITC